MNRLQEILEAKQFPGIRTRDTFGIKNEFYDPQTKQWIDNRSKWEKAGFRNPLETHTDPNVKAGIKRKIEKITKYDSGKRKSYLQGG